MNFLILFITPFNRNFVAFISSLCYLNEGTGFVPCTSQQFYICFDLFSFKGYKVYQSGVGLLTTTDKHSYSVTSLQSKTAYSFTVKPYNKAGEGPGATIQVTTKGGRLYCTVLKVWFHMHLGTGQKVQGGGRTGAFGIVGYKITWPTPFV